MSGDSNGFGGAKVGGRKACVIGLLLMVGCRAATPGDEVARSDSALTARTWGLAYLQQNQLPQAEAEFRKIVALAPNQALGYADLGLVYLRGGRHREAEAQLRRAAALDSANGDIGLTLAKVYEVTGREADARREVERVLRRDSTDIRALYALAELAGRSADPRERQRPEGYVRQVVARGDPLPEFDLHCPLLGLPLRFGTSIETIPADVPLVSRVSAVPG